MNASKLIDKKLFQEHLESSFEMVKANFRGDPQTEEMPKMLVAMLTDKGDDWEFHLIGFADLDETRFDTLKRIGIKYGLERRMVVAAYFISEAWMSVLKAEEFNAHPENRVMPSEDPDRIEIVFVAGMTIDLYCQSLAAEIKRDSQGKRVSLNVLDNEADAMESNLLTSFFQGYAQGYMGVGRN